MVNPDKFLYLPSLISGVALAIVLVVAVLNLAKRVYEIIFMYFVMPMSMSTLPLDDGARFKTWRETFITKIVIAYGTVFSVNIFVLLLPLITRMRIDEISGFGNSMFLIFMIVGGAMVIPAGQALFCKLFGQADDMHAGGNFLRSAFYGSRMVTAARVSEKQSRITGKTKQTVVAEGTIRINIPKIKLLPKQRKDRKVMYQVGSYEKSRQTDEVKSKLNQEIAKLDEKMKRLTRMRLDDEISKADYLEYKSEIERDRERLIQQRTAFEAGIETDCGCESAEGKIQNFLLQKMDFTEHRIDREVISQFVDTVIPRTETCYEWYSVRKLFGSFYDV